MRRWPDRLRRALRLDPDLFEEVEHDYSAGTQALLTVLAASACGGVGNLIACRLIGLGPRAWPSLIVMTAGFVVAWIVWSFLTMAIGTTFFGGKADMGEMQRALGFAAAPGLLLLIPGLGLLIGIPWSLLAMVIAVRQALDFDTRRAVYTVLTSALVMAFLAMPTGCFLHVRGVLTMPPKLADSSAPLFPVAETVAARGAACENPATRTASSPPPGASNEQQSHPLP
jgi:hypothetical protein